MDTTGEKQETADFLSRWPTTDKSGKRGIAEIGAAPFKGDFAELAVLAVPENDPMPRLQLASARALCVGEDQPSAAHRIMTFRASELIASVGIQNQRGAGALDALTGDTHLRADIAARHRRLGAARWRAQP